MAPTKDFSDIRVGGYGRVNGGFNVGFRSALHDAVEQLPTDKSMSLKAATNQAAKPNNKYTHNHNNVVVTNPGYVDVQWGDFCKHCGTIYYMVDKTKVDGNALPPCLFDGGMDD